MIRLSDVKVQLQYRWRMRQRLMVLHFARLHGPTAAARRSVRDINAVVGSDSSRPRHRPSVGPPSQRQRG